MDNQFITWLSKYLIHEIFQIKILERWECILVSSARGMVWSSKIKPCDKSIDNSNIPEKMKTILVDSDFSFLDQLECTLTSSFPSMTILHRYKGYNLVQSEMKRDADLMVINISSHESMVGLTKNTANQCGLIFTAPTYEYASTAMCFGAAGYLIKPLKKSEVVATVSHYYDLRYQTLHRAKIGFQRNDFMADMICVPTMDGAEFFHSNEIIRCEGLQKCTRIVANKRSDIVSSYNIGVFRELLSEQGFIQPHKSHLVNLRHILKYHREGVLIMRDKSSIPVSRRRKNDLFKSIRLPSMYR